MELGKMLLTVIGARKALSEMRQILKDDEDQMEMVISREVLLGWYRRILGLVMIMEKFHVE